MIAVYSLWNMGDPDHRAGFNSISDLVACMKLSMIQSGKFFDKVILVTDTIGADLSRAHRLPYDEVRVEFDGLKYHKHFWAIPKLLALRSVNSPDMMHIDNDWIWTSYNHKIWDGADMLFQCVEPYADYPFYDKQLDFLKAHYPDIYYKYLADSDCAYNCGVIGVRDPAIIAIWERWAHQLIHAPDLLNKWTDADKGWFNLIYEQSMIVNLCKEQNLKVAFVLPDHSPSFKHFLATAKHDDANMKMVHSRLAFEEKYSKPKSKIV